MLSSRAVRLGSLPVLGIGFLQVRAESAPSDVEERAATVQLVKPRDFPIYGEPKADEFKLIPEGSSSFKDVVSTARKQVWKCSENFQSAATFTKNTCKTTEETFKSVVKYVKTEEGFYPRAGVISVAGLAGLVLARRGGFFRKVFYSGGLMTAAASLCYPYKAVRIGKAEVAWVQDKATELYNSNVSKPAVEKVASTVSNDEKAASESKTEEASGEGETGQTENKGEVEGDPGQSNPADKDMYTTRS